jgi:multiple sugar transport system substrate-binding protein
MAKGGATLENMFFKDQNLAMWPHYTNVARRIPENVNWDAAPMPYYSGAIGVAPAADTYFLFVTSTSKHKQQAFDVAAFLTQTEAQINLSKEGFTPIVRDKEVQDVFGKNYKTYSGKNVSAFFPAKLAPAAPYSRYYSTADSTLFTEFVNYVVGKKALNTALRDYQEAANKKIQEQIATGK